MDGISKIRVQRPDLSPYLFHFTKGANPERNMNEILSTQKLVSDEGYICFTEAPISSMIPLLDYFAGFPKPMYSRYAIGFNRKILVENYLAQPVIYGVGDDKSKIDSSLHWKYLEYNPTNNDYQWLREWRIKGGSFDFSKFPREEIIIITPDNDSLLRISSEEDFDVEFVYEHEIRASRPYLKYKAIRKWIGFSLDDLRREEKLTDYQISGMTLMQNLEENIFDSNK